MPVLIGIFAFGLLLLVTPIGLGIAGVELGNAASAAMIGFGTLLMLLGGALALVTKLYRKTSANEAFVRTGMGGLKIIKDGGAMVIPVIHQLVVVSLETLQLTIVREGKDALITADKLRADISAEFFIKVPADPDAIQTASRSLGERMSDPAKVKELLEKKLVSALRSAASQRTLEQLNSDRATFIEDVSKLVENDLRENGLELETATISNLDQAPVSSLDENNIFDAQGLRTIAEITEKNRTEANEIQRTNEEARKNRDVQTRLIILNKEKEEQEAEARQEAEVASVRAEQQRLAEEAQIAAQREVEVAAIEKQKALEVANEQRESAQAVAEEQKRQATVRARQEVEVAERAKEQAVAEAEAERAAAEQALAEAEALREEARQKVQTVAVVEAAERAKQQQVIAATAAAEQDLITKQKAADAEAYEVEKSAEARKASADADAIAEIKAADAARKAAEARAAGDQALALVPVTVSAQQVAVDRDREMITVDVAEKQVQIDRDRVETVLKPELEAREANGRVAQEFELEQLRIREEAGVRKAQAESAAKIGSNVKMELYGTPEDATGMFQNLVKGLGITRLAEGLVKGADDVLEGLDGTVLGEAGKAALGAVTSAVIKKAQPQLPPGEGSNADNTAEGSV